MFFGWASWMQKRWVANHVGDTILKALFGLALSLVYFAISYFILNSWGQSAFEAGSSIPEQANEVGGTSRTRMGAKMLPLILSIFLLIPYWKFFMLIVHPVVAWSRGMTRFEWKRLKKDYEAQRHAAMVAAGPNGVVAQEYGSFGAWRAYHFPPDGNPFKFSKTDMG